MRKRDLWISQAWGPGRALCTDLKTTRSIAMAEYLMTIVIAICVIVVAYVAVYGV